MAAMTFKKLKRLLPRPPDDSSPRASNSEKMEQIASALIIALRLLRDSADAFPPLKSVASGLMHLVDLSKELKGNREESMRLLERSKRLTSVLTSIPDIARASDELRLEIVLLSSVLDEIVLEMKELGESKSFSRFIYLDKHRDRVRVLRERLDEAVWSFETGCIVRTEVFVKLVLTKLDDHTENSKLKVPNQRLPGHGHLSGTDITPSDGTKILPFSFVWWLSV